MRLMEQNNLQPQTGKLRLHEDVELPIDGLPQLVQQYINEIVRVYHCPIEFPTVAVFSVIATAIGKRVKITDRKYTNPLMLWFVNVAISGSNKTQPVKEVLRPLREINRENYETYEREYELWKADKERDENNPPSFNQLLVGDCTEEARIKILQNSSHGVLGHYPEVKGFFDDMDRYNKGGFVDKLLRMFDGDDVFVNRKGEYKPIVISDVFMNILGDIQPGLLGATFGSSQFMENGLNQRFLFTMPNIVEFPDREIEAMDAGIVADWCSVVKQIYKMDLRDWGLISLSPECDTLYTEYFNLLQRKKEKVRNYNGDGYLLSVYSKLQIQAQRLAGIVHLMWLINSPQSYNYRQVSAEDMEYTIRCMNYFEQTAVTVYERIIGKSAEMQSNAQPRSQAQVIRDFSAAIPIVNVTRFAEGIGKDKGYISKVLSSDIGKK
jgi:hypothetical protein B2_09768